MPVPDGVPVHTDLGPGIGPVLAAPSTATTGRVLRHRLGASFGRPSTVRRFARALPRDL